MFKKSLFLASLLIFLFSFQLAPVAQAAAGDCGTDPNDPLGLNCAAGSGLTKDDPRLVVARIINVALSILGTIAVVLIVYAGFLWMTAGGNDDQAGKARSIIFASIIGLVIILSAYAISTFVVKNVYEATTGGNYP